MDLTVDRIHTLKSSQNQNMISLGNIIGAVLGREPAAAPVSTGPECTLNHAAYTGIPWIFTVDKVP